ncbi:MAG: helix-turn-helix transcriptional regulator [Anaerolineae bacterium]|jgi:transcriptional regulator with XRE-family HTH domain
MEAPQAADIRNKIIGILVKRARLDAGKTQRDCAEILGCSPSTFSQYERGKKGLALPEIEVLACFLDVPLQTLLDGDHAAARQEEEDLLPLSQIMQIRQRILAVQFRKCREATGLTQQGMGDLLGTSAYMISQYESGKRQIPLAELELAAEQCGQTLDDFIDKESLPLGRTERERRMVARLEELSPEVREFVLKPTNNLYLRIALLLSAMKADSLRQIAETLLDITY